MRWLGLYIVVALILAGLNGCGDTEGRSGLRSDGKGKLIPGGPSPDGDDDGNPEIPKAVDKAGVDFENDPTSTSPDYADALICVEGKLHLYENSKKLVVTQDGTIKISFKNPSACEHRFNIAKKSASDAVLMTQEQADTMGATVDLEFVASADNILEITLLSKDCAGTVSQLDMAHTGQWTRLSANTCN